MKINPSSLLSLKNSKKTHKEIKLFLMLGKNPLTEEKKEILEKIGCRILKDENNIISVMVHTSKLLELDALPFVKFIEF